MPHLASIGEFLQEKSERVCCGLPLVAGPEPGGSSGRTRAHEMEVLLRPSHDGHPESLEKPTPPKRDS